MLDRLSCELTWMIEGWHHRMRRKAEGRLCRSCMLFDWVVMMRMVMEAIEWTCRRFDVS